MKSWRCRGYATEAVVAMLQFALTQPRVTEVIASTDPGNTASLRVLERADCPTSHETTQRPST